MEYVIITLTVLIGSGLTFFSGFGLGTLLLPVFSLFFDLPVAVGATAVVHLANNLFKFAMVSRYIDKKTLVRFGVPAMIAAAIGGWILTIIGDTRALATYTLFDHTFSLSTIGIVIGTLMIFFAWFDLNPKTNEWKIAENKLAFGGFLSGFFGGISGHQGAFRATFLTKAGLSKESFVGTSNAVSLIVDITRLLVYFVVTAKSGEEVNKFYAAFTEGHFYLATGIVCAFIGTYFGKMLLKKTTINGIQRIVGVLLVVMGILFITGII